ncbi:N-formylglutamate amidohydrolase [Polymorphobacter glacialis]|uniref:N-formylglutamate amidohydrolase n=1 Tax=Sandarakinorhabdus glacialis TaxID=1614636 RepID=A0A916ZP18_9SPHN|nr:N-formylglutamate amidohydrolase [Polymorphobacter glacialis]GGE07126.1 N-formylglutamate amidohydrolase [Polymorphobacter glacialis]
MTDDSQRILLDDELSPVAIVNPNGTSPYLLVGDHAGNVIPNALGQLGVSHDDLVRHIAWDIGTETLGRSLAHHLDAVFIRQVYSRLVIDCNRDPDAAGAMPAESDGTAIPGNIGLDDAARRRRVAEIHEPYQAAIASALAPAHMLVSLHSFTPRMGGADRPWDIGILHAGHNDTLALRLLGWLEARSGLTIGNNEPYRMDGTDYTVPRHAFAAERPYVELEVRQDLLADPVQNARMAALLAEGMSELAYRMQPGVRYDR